MPTFPLPQGGLAFGQTFATTTYGTTLTGGGANAQGTPVELIASTDHDAHWIEVMTGNPSGTQSYALNILIGASTEAILIPGLAFRAKQLTEGGNRWLFPVFIPKGSRIAASVQSTGAGATCLVAVVLFNSGITTHGMPTNVVHYGGLAGGPGLGTNIDPGAVAHTKAGLTEITAATERDHHWLVLTVSNIDTAWGGVAKKLIDVLIGSSTEAVLVANLAIGGAGTSDKQLPEEVFHLPVFVPKGSRLAVRAQSSSTTDGDRDLYVTIHGA
jgi:hypothetical protein